MKKIIFLMQINFILLLGSVSSFSQETPQDLAKKHFDRGMAIIENAQSQEDFKTAIKEFEEAKSLSPNWSDVYYNLGLLFDKMEMYNESIENLKFYIQLDPNADDAETVKTMINKIDYKAEQFLNPETLEGIWYFSRPKASSEPRLEMKIVDGTVQARCLPSEAWEDELPIGDFVPISWNNLEGELTIIEAPFFDCDESVDPDWCPHKVTLSLKRTGENKLEGELTDTGINYTSRGPEIDTFSHNVVFERYEE